ncbi:23S rRNA (pseudouridine(1915)-N(3))-methyltransferase RlmH [Vallitaleaceae bacterium 9-2]
MNFTIIHQEKKLPSFYSNAIKEYHKRLQRYCKIQLISCSSDAAIAKKMAASAYIIGISVDTSTYTSVDFAHYLSQLGISGHSRLTLIINPSDAILNQCNAHIALSALVNEPGVILTLLFEQIYRAYRINLNQAYHK